MVWNFPDPVPLHREPLYTPRRDLVAAVPDLRRPQAEPPAAALQVDPGPGLRRAFPIILTSGRLVEYEGGGDETRSNPWLAELQQNMFVEVNPIDANDAGVRDGGMVWVHGPEGAKVRVMAMLTERVGRASPSCRSTSAATSRARTCRQKYPRGLPTRSCSAKPTNTAQTYGYDSVTQMQETKTTLCRIEAA